MILFLATADENELGAHLSTPASRSKFNNSGSELLHLIINYALINTYPDSAAGASPDVLHGRTNALRRNLREY